MLPEQYPSSAADSMGTASRTVADIAGSVALEASPKVPTCGGEMATTCVGEGRHNRVRRGVAETSAEAFHSLSPAHYLSPKERAVLALFTGPEVKLSRQQIADMACMPLCGCCGRVDSLLTKGSLEECGDRRLDPRTGKSQKLLQLPRAAQGELVERGDA